MSEVTIQGRDGGFSAYLAAPATGRGAGVVVIQEIFGVNEVVRGIADYLAAQGYFALAPTCSGGLSPACSSPTRPTPNGSRPSI